MTRFDFIKKTKLYFTISIVLIVACIAGALIRGVNLDIQFKGGSLVTYSYEGGMDEDAVNRFATLIQDLTDAVVTTQQSTDLATNTKTIVVSLPGGEGLDADKMLEIVSRLQEAFPENNIQVMESNQVDPTIGREFLAKCLVAVALASVLMLLYVWWRFRKIGGLSAGAMAVVALVHDVIITFSIYVILGMSINDNFMAVILTIFGYSLNDTIVIYDRIRENTRKAGPRGGDVAEIVNLSINQSLKRSMITSITTITAMVIVSVVAAVYGVTSILSFSLPLVFGLACGNYSSLCIAGPLWVKWQQRKEKLA